MRSRVALRSVFLFPLLLGLALLGLAQNRSPIADAGDDRMIFLGSDAVLDGSRSFDPDGTPIASLAWTIESSPAGSSPLLFFSSTATPFLVPDLVGDYEISLVVSDGLELSAPDTVVVHVLEKRDLSDF